jgi:hypothetical protein
MNNVATERIALWVHANIFSSRLRKWREAHGTRHQSDHVGGGQLGNLVRPFSWFDWDLSNPEQRSHVIDEVIGDLRSIALPYFQQFENIDCLASGLITGTVLEVRIEAAVELLLCYFDKSAANAYIGACLVRHSEVLPEVLRLIENSRTLNMPLPRETGYSIELATAIVCHKLDITTPGASKQT